MWAASILPVSMEYKYSVLFVCRNDKCATAVVNAVQRTFDIKVEIFVSNRWLIHRGIIDNKVEVLIFYSDDFYTTLGIIDDLRTARKIDWVIFADTCSASHNYSVGDVVVSMNAYDILLDCQSSSMTINNSVSLPSETKRHILDLNKKYTWKNPTNIMIHCVTTGSVPYTVGGLRLEWNEMCEVLDVDTYKFMYSMWDRRVNNYVSILGVKNHATGDNDATNAIVARKNAATVACELLYKVINPQQVVKPSVTVPTINASSVLQSSPDIPKVGSTNSTSLDELRRKQQELEAIIADEERRLQEEEKRLQEEEILDRKGIYDNIMEQVIALAKRENDEMRRTGKFLCSMCGCTTDVQDQHLKSHAISHDAITGKVNMWDCSFNISELCDMSLELLVRKYRIKLYNPSPIDMNSK